MAILLQIIARPKMHAMKHAVADFDFMLAEVGDGLEFLRQFVAAQLSAAGFWHSQPADASAISKTSRAPADMGPLR